MMCRYPFDTKKYEIRIENPTGRYAHENFPESRYANDFILPLGAPILAALGGVVFSARYESSVYYSTKDVRDLSLPEVFHLVNKYTNFVVLDHRDGTFVEYCHLAKRKVVTNRQFIEEGKVIGYVGLSGIIDSPHLHFNGFRIENKRGISIPVEFIE